MPIYEYKAVDEAHCRLCKGRFEVRQRIADGPLGTCPECGAAVKRLFSAPFVLRKDSLSYEETFDSSVGEEADEFGTEDDFAEYDDWG